ncbi:Histidine kinase [Soonwooa buanensis]|uniref:Histidine kinase n=1 Tax=Soonwooa buanensis TaxID=619805 RepID=A0A1T5EGV0_9FLAO|nr:Histidine kinase [Soonwooa buanensis]
MRKNQLFLLQSIFWIINFIGTVLIPKFVFNADHVLLDITFFVTTFICFYINYFFVVPKFFDIHKLYKSLIGFFVSVICFVLIRYFIEEILLIWITGSGNYAPGTGLGFYFFDNIYYSSTTIFISSVFSLINKFMKVEEERLQLVSEKKHAEIQALKTQINPHFIFNSLNNIYSLVYQKSDKALPAIEELSELLRYSTKDLQQDFIPLKREVGYIESLIALEKLRIRNPEKIIFEKNIQNENLQISPMLLVPFVENAFKHGDFNEHEMKIDLKEENNILNFRIENQKRQGSKDHASGIGITNVKKRLELIYPKKHELNISDKEIFFVVELKIEL